MEPVAQTTHRRWTRKHLLLAAGLALVVAGTGVFFFRDGLKNAVEAVVAALREAGPAVFFAAMALLPAVGFPLMAFTLAAGPVFGPALGTGWVITWSLTAVVANLLLTHWLSNRALRPLVTRWLAYFDFKLPDLAADGAWPLTLLVRLTPGPPFWAQSYLLGLIRVPLLPYLVVSTLVMAGYIIAIVLGGDALAEGNGGLAVTALAVLVFVVAALHLLRQRTARRRAVLAAIPVK